MVPFRQLLNFGSFSMGFRRITAGFTNAASCSKG